MRLFRRLIAGARAWTAGDDEALPPLLRLPTDALHLWTAPLSAGLWIGAWLASNHAWDWCWWFGLATAGGYSAVALRKQLRDTPSTGTRFDVRVLSIAAVLGGALLTGYAAAFVAAALACQLGALWLGWRATGKA